MVKRGESGEWWPLLFNEKKSICLVLCLGVWWKVCGRKKRKEFIFPGRILGNHLSHSQVRCIIKRELERVEVKGENLVPIVYGTVGHNF